MPIHSLDEFLDSPIDAVSSPTKTVPNLFPTITNTPYRIAVIGEAPGSDEIDQGKPFVGYSGQLLDKFLSRFNILRDACFIGNICQHQPPSNKLAVFDWDGPQISGGIAKLTDDLTRYRPNVVLLLGGSALHTFKDPLTVPNKRKTKDGVVFAFPNSIGEWRGSFFEAHMNAPLAGVKCIASYHPAFCLRSYEFTPHLMLDIKRAKDDAETTELNLPQRKLLVNLSFEETCAEMDKILTAKPIIGTDIEGFWNNLKCISFAPSPDYSFIVPFTKMDGSSLWDYEQEVQLMKRVVAILADTKIIKVWQNGLYDRFVFQFGFNTIVRGTSRDIMLKHWEMYSELEKKLGVQASIYTREPFYKEERESETRETFWAYCCRDSAVTLEIDQKLDRIAFNVNDKTPTDDRAIRLGRKRHYEFNESLLCALLYMQKRGLRFDKPTATKRLNEVLHKTYELQNSLDQISGFGVKTTDKTVLRALIRDAICYKRDSSKPFKGHEEDYDWSMRVLLGEGPLVPAELGRLSTVLKLQLNVEGGKFKPYLYETLKLPEQRNKDTKELTSDYEAQKKLLLFVKEESKSTAKSDRAKALKILPLSIEIGELRTRSEHLQSMVDCTDHLHDGRVHTFYNEVGSETGRVTCGKLFKKYGYPMQTVEDENELKPEGHPLRNGLRDLLLADDDCLLAKCDLKGADGWTIGAHLAALGDSTMLDDLKCGLKPAAILCYASRHGSQSIVGKTREQLAEVCKEVRKSDWDYFAYKQCIWGFCYLLGVEQAVKHVFKVSEGTVLVKEADMQMAKDMLFRRYNISLLHRATEKKLFTQPYPPLWISPSGHARKFFARRSDIVGQALAHEPQSVTTYATNQAVYRCWTDPENRSILTSSDEFTSIQLRVEPLHQVHDEFLCQFHTSDTAWAINKIRQWFSNPIRIAGIEVTIPFEGNYGTNWAMDEHSKKGVI